MGVVQSIRQDLGPEAVAVPDVEVVLQAEHVHLCGRPGGFAERGRDDDASLGIEFGELAPVGRGHFEGFARLVHLGHGAELFLDRFPDLEGVQADEFPSGRQAGQVERRPVLRFDVRAKGAGHLEAPLVINPG